MAILEHVGDFWHGRKQDTIGERPQVNQGESQDREQGAGIEVGLPGCLVVCSRLMVDYPSVQVVQSNFMQKTQPVDKEGRNEVDPSPSPVYSQTLACSNNLLLDLIIQSNPTLRNHNSCSFPPCLTFGSRTKSGKSKNREDEEGREFEDETEDSPPIANSSVNGDETQDDPQARDTGSICNKCLA